MIWSAFLQGAGEEKRDTESMYKVMPFLYNEMGDKKAKTEAQDNSPYLHLIMCGHGARSERIHGGWQQTLQPLPPVFMKKGGLRDTAPPIHAATAECGQKSLEYYYLYRKCLPSPGISCSGAQGWGRWGGRQK